MREPVRPLLHFRRGNRLERQNSEAAKFTSQRKSIAEKLVTAEAAFRIEIDVRLYIRAVFSFEFFSPIVEIVSLDEKIVSLKFGEDRITLGHTCKFRVKINEIRQKLFQKYGFL